MLAPPSEGADHVSVVVPFTVSVVATGADGATGTVDGVTELLLDDILDAPFVLIAFIEYQFALPNVIPVVSL
mgnify:CR=1 FL=1